VGTSGFSNRGRFNKKKDQSIIVAAEPGAIISVGKKITNDILVETQIKLQELLTREATMKENAEQWIEDYAAGYGISYAEIMQTAWTHVEDEDGNSGWGNHITRGAELEGAYTSSEFWDKFEIVTGKSVERHVNFFSCSC
jgi:hypothetical protein